MSLPVSIFGVVTMIFLSASHIAANVQFDSSTYFANVKENQTEAQDVAIVTASDPDDPDAIISYTLAPSTYFDYFTINATTGEVRTLTEPALDREKTDVLNFTVTATSNNQTAGRAIATLQVTLLDINDNRPRFQVTGFRVEFPQHFKAGEQVQLPTATDEDPQHNSIMYTNLGLSSSSPDGWDSYFKIDDKAATITTIKACDDDCKKKYQRNPFHEYKFEFTLTASNGDTGNLNDWSSRVEIIVVLMYNDTNKHAPKFQKDTYALAVRNDTKADGQVLLTVIALDMDSGTNGQISYTIEPSTDERVKSIFEVNKKTGNISLQKHFDPGVDMYAFTVVATDAGDLPKSGTAEVKLFVRSVIPVGDVTTLIAVAAGLSAVVLFLLAIAIFLGVRYRRARADVEEEKKDKARLVRLHKLELDSRDGHHYRPDPTERTRRGSGDYNLPDNYEDPPDDSSPIGDDGYLTSSSAPRVTHLTGDQRDPNIGHSPNQLPSLEQHGRGNSRPPSYLPPPCAHPGDVDYITPKSPPSVGNLQFSNVIYSQNDDSTGNYPRSDARVGNHDNYPHSDTRISYFPHNQARISEVRLEEVRPTVHDSYVNPIAGPSTSRHA